MKLKKEIVFHQDSNLNRMALIENNTVVLITDWKRNLLHLVDLDGNILNSLNPNNIFKRVLGVCVLISDSKEELFIGDAEHRKVFVLNSNL